MSVDTPPAEVDTPIALELNGVHAHYGMSHVLQGVDLAVPAGEITCLLGRNGVGKTTTIACIMGLLRRSGGEIQFGGKPINAKSAYQMARRGVTLVPEGRWIFTGLTVGDNLRLAARVGKGRTEFGIDEAYALFPDLAPRRKAAAGLLSGGQQQMLALARALLTGPDLVLLDEPTQGLAPRYVDMVVEYVRDLKKRGITVLLVEQNLHVALTVADHVLLMDHGRIAYRGRPQDLVENEELLWRYLAVRAVD